MSVYVPGVRVCVMWNSVPLCSINSSVNQCVKALIHGEVISVIGCKLNSVQLSALLLNTHTQTQACIRMHEHVHTYIHTFAHTSTHWEALALLVPGDPA